MKFNSVCVLTVVCANIFVQNTWSLFSCTTYFRTLTLLYWFPIHSTAFSTTCMSIQTFIETNHCNDIPVRHHVTYMKIFVRFDFTSFVAVVTSFKLPCLIFTHRIYQFISSRNFLIDLSLWFLPFTVLSSLCFLLQMFWGFPVLASLLHWTKAMGLLMMSWNSLTKRLNRK